MPVITPAAAKPAAQGSTRRPARPARPAPRRAVRRILTRAPKTVAAAILAAVIPLLGACTPFAVTQPAPAPGTSQHLAAVHDPGQVTGTIAAPCRYRDGGQLPDPRCTPGSIDPAVTQASIRQTICTPGYTKRVRPAEAETERFKYDVAYPAYGVPDSRHTELDHEVPLELGGSNAAANLWPEWPPTPNPKDTVENALHAAVCDGQVSLTAAQQAIARDWMTAESRLGLG